MELREALCQISEIRQQMARSEVFRGYRSMTVGCSGLWALLAAGCQPYFVASPGAELARYLSLWISVAAVSVMVAGGEMWWRARIAGAGLGRQITLLAVEQFLPSVLVGALLTFCIYRGAPEAAWMLPGLWSLVFSLGVFASYRLTPNGRRRFAEYIGVLESVVADAQLEIQSQAGQQPMPGGWSPA